MVRTRSGRSHHALANGCRHANGEGGSMDGFLTQGLIGLYVLTNGLRVLSYVPQIVAVARDHSGAHAIALSTWTFWTIANATTSLYAFRVPGDVLLAVISAANAICCLTVVAIVVYKRRVQARAHRPARLTFATIPCLSGARTRSTGKQKSTR